MHRLERSATIMQALLSALEGWQSGLWTAMPCIIDSFNAAAMTITCRPAIRARVLKQDGSTEWVAMPVMGDVPVVFPGGGGFALTFPVAAGDEALVIFASRCIDAWWQSGGVQNQAELRMHDLSDGFALVGVRSQPRVLAGVSTTSVTLRSDDGTAEVEIAADKSINLVSPVSVNITAPNVNVVASGEVHMTTPDLKVTGEITMFEGTPQETTMSDFINTYNIHTHDGVQVGGGNTGNPNQQVP